MTLVIDEATLITYIREELGEPVIKVNVDDEHIKNAIYQALELFYEFNHKGSALIHYKYKVTSTDVTNGYITIPDEIDEVTRVIPGGSNDINSAQFGTYLYQMKRSYTADQWLAGGYQLMDVTLFQTYFSTIEQVVGSNMNNIYSWERVNHRLTPLWNMEADDVIAFECYRKTGDFSAAPTEVYNDKWVKKMAIAYTKKKWGDILSKFQGVALPGGITLDGNKMQDDAERDIEKFEQELIDKYQPPDQFFLM